MSVNDTLKSYEAMNVKRTFTHQEHGTTCLSNEVPINVSLPTNKYASTINGQYNTQSEDLFSATTQKNISTVKKIKQMIISLDSGSCLKGRDDFSLYIFSNEHK